MDLVAILKGKSDLFDGSQIGAQLVARRERARNAAAARNPTRNAVRKRLLFLVCSSNRVCGTEQGDLQKEPSSPELWMP